MTSNRTINGLAYALAASLALGTAASHAADATTPDTAASAPVNLAQATMPIRRMEVRERLGTTAGFPPQQAGVRKAAAEGSTALRRYVSRTKAIYNYYYWDFAKYLPGEAE